MKTFNHDCDNSARPLADFLPSTIPVAFLLPDGRYPRSFLIGETK